ncbi:MAG: metal-dependent transcriptional regulator, partial [Peptostreptococcaceae bacterium]
MNDLSEYYTFNEYMKKNKLTPNEEDYMEIIYRISIEKENITVSDVSKYLNITPASVSKMIKKLSEKELLIYERYGYIKLNDLGSAIGKKLL